MPIGSRLLFSGGVITAGASLLHVAIIIGGPDWYRFFGAGERMAQRASRGSLSAAAITASIAIALGIWAFYAFSALGMIRTLPFLGTGLALISAVYFGRGILGIPLVLLVDEPYLNELKTKMTFMAVTSAICIYLGVCYAAGALLVWKATAASRA